MNKLLSHARDLGCTEAWVLTERANEAAVRLYSSAGGKETPKRPVIFTFRLNADASGRGG